MDPQKQIFDLDFASAMLKTRAMLPRFVITTGDGEPYLERVKLDESTYLHVIYRSDDDRDPHDHPWDFESKIIWGSYTEHLFRKGRCDAHALQFGLAKCEACDSMPLEEETRIFGPGDMNRKSATQLHLLKLTAPVITLVTRGAKRRDWGFQTSKGWIDHRSYLTEKFGSVSEYE